MSPRLSSLLLTSSLLAITALVGCAESESESEPEPEPEPEPRFADATPTQLDRAYTASSGLDMLSMLLYGRSFQGKNDPTGCPAVVTTGLDTTVTGGCTTESGIHLEGLIALHNIGFPPADPSQPYSAALDYRVTHPDGKRMAFTGHLELHGRSKLRGELTLDGDGIKSTSRLDLTCEAHWMCFASPGSAIELSDFGSASVEGTWAIYGTAGRVLVRGTDELVLEMLNRSSDGCVPYKVGDRSGRACINALTDLSLFF